MSQTITIGMLLPNSSILPIGKDFEKGLKKELENQDLEIDYVKEFIGNGGFEITQRAVNKLVGYDHADIITGVINHRMVAKIAEVFSKRGKLIAANVGENWPNPEFPNVSIHSLNAWQQIWAMSKWATKEIGPKGMFVSGLYDSGYSFMSAMNQGMLDSGIETQLRFMVAPAPGFQDGKIAEVHRVIPFIEKENPDFIFSAFCGEEASLFLEYWAQSGLSDKISVLSLPYLLEPANLPFPIKLFTTQLSDDNMDKYGEYTTPQAWKKDYYYLGQCVGTEISDKFNSGKNDHLNVSSNLSSNGKIQYSREVTLYQVDYSGEISNSVFNKIVLLGSSDESESMVKKYFNKQSGGWNNPYLSL
jgi:hypothetical protein